MEPRLKLPTSKIILKNFSMNIHEAVLQPIAACVYCNRHAAADRRRQTNVGNFHAPQAPAQLNLDSVMEFGL